MSWPADALLSPSPLPPSLSVPLSRRTFLSSLSLLLAPRLLAAMPRLRPAPGWVPHPHPEPRPGITSARVLPPGALQDATAAAAFDIVRQIPQIIDGIRCSCGCAGLKGYYSLLSCYEDAGMAQHCVICQGQATLAYKLHKQGWSLRGIRRSIDAAYGD